MKFFLIFLLGLINCTYGSESTDSFSDEKENYFKLLETKYVLIPHKGTYLLPFVFNTRPHDEIYKGIINSLSNQNSDFYKKEEAEFQISFMIPIQRKMLDTNFDLNVAYTHHAWWQLYNPDNSRPFRETNYIPEIFLRYIDPSATKVGGFDFRGVDFGFIHESNGQIQLLSRSWNRVYIRTLLQNSGFQVFTSAWYRIPEKKNEDENRDIYKYMGFGELEISKSLGKHTLTFKTPIAARHVSLDFKYSYPWKENLRWYVSVETGYAHSLIEYNYSTRRYGIGFVLDSFIDRYTLND